MNATKTVTVIHPDSTVRIALRSLLQSHGCTVATDHSCRDLMSAKPDFTPNLILLDRSQLRDEGVEVLAQLNRRWGETEIVFLPEGLALDPAKSPQAKQLLQIIDRLLRMRTTSELLAV